MYFFTLKPITLLNFIPPLFSHFLLSLQICPCNISSDHPTKLKVNSISTPVYNPDGPTPSISTPFFYFLIENIFLSRIYSVYNTSPTPPRGFPTFSLTHIHIFSLSLSLGYNSASKNNSDKIKLDKIQTKQNRTEINKRKNVK